MPIEGGARTLTHALRSLDSDGVGVHDVGLRKPTLDDVFLTLTGHAAEPQAPTPPRSTPTSVCSGGLSMDTLAATLSDGVTIARRNVIKIRRVPQTWSPCWSRHC